MANIYVGFHDQRSSSRVLKPPGGGSSDIFGTSPTKVKDEEVKSTPSTPVKDSVDVKSQNAREEKSDSVANAKREEPKSEDPKIENLVISEKNGERAEDHQHNDAKATAKPDTISSIIRQSDKVQSPVAEPEPKNKTPQRVPPGGFSSGLW